MAATVNGPLVGLAFAVTAAVGGVLRHLVNRRGWGWRGTLAVNVVGAFLLGALAGRGGDADALTVLGTGLLGAFTTFSGFALEVVEAPRRDGVVITAGTLVLGIAAAAAGWALGG
jgi:CrcB protein